MSSTATDSLPSRAPHESQVRAVRPRRARPRRRRNRRRVVRHTLLTVVLGVIGFAWLYPMLWMVSASLKDNITVFTDMSLLPSAPEFENYARAWWTANMGRYFWNTVIVTVATVTITLLTTSTIGYVLGTYSFPGKRIVIGAIIAVVFLPEGYTIIPLFEVISALGLSTSLAGLILAESGGAQIMIILLFAGYFRQMPKDLLEAARIDGAGFLRSFWSIMLPLAKPVMATAVIMTIMRVWNSFLIPLVLTLSRPDQRTLAVGVYAFQGENSTDWTGMAAASTMSILPIVIAFLLLQRHFVEGIAGAVRG
ncbi:carbohydrate ABC transporter permease [Brachybacterium sacelli]|uniref:Raffinose/stachyose/melibiose transport system permease protein n=1 Tax=Brachybacterium sacelli TaxID=173364 RepID=A0ABS4X1A8_9MICO|nr:carbohydrate ABC transporter permease [Brachybacterium sacelli]MBP2381519.1 raffinose/stachyose/melibiose transport system permease protein [Brachybacterium sacelli]